MMYRRLRALFITSLVVGGLSFAFYVPTFAADQGNTGGVTGDRSNTNQADTRGISQAIAQCVEAATNPNGADQLMQCFSKEAQQRIWHGGKTGQKGDTGQSGQEGQTGQEGQAGEQGKTGQAGQQGQHQAKYNDQLTTALQTFQRNWKEQYNTDLRFANAEQVFGPEFFRISGEARPAGGRIEGGSSGGTTGGTSGTTGGGTSGNTGNTGSGTTGGTTGQGTSGMNMQTVTIPGQAGQPELTVNFTKDGNQWKLNPTQDMTSDQLYNSLTQHVNRLNQDRQFWPKDQQQAQRLVAYHILAAVSGSSKDMKDHKDMKDQKPGRPGESGQPGEGGQPGSETNR